MSALKFTPLTLGADRIASVGSRLNEEHLSALFATASRLGIAMIDTADSYASGESERRIGSLANSATKGFQVVSKTGYRYGTLPGCFYPINQVIKKALHSTGLRQCFSSAHVRRNALRSLKRLARPPSLYLLHNPPMEALTTDLRVTLETLVKDGVIGCYGVSSFEPKVLRAAMELPTVAALQTAVNPATARELQPVLKEATLRGIPVMAHSACPRECIDLVANEARRLETESRHVLIQFALQQPGVSTVITGTHSPEHLSANASWASTPLAIDFDQFIA
jgi:aryl-alcohol dehydrogenase-like predicted oxidoreductase